MCTHQKQDFYVPDGEECIIVIHKYIDVYLLMEKIKLDEWWYWNQWKYWKVQRVIWKSKFDYWSSIWKGILVLKQLWVNYQQIYTLNFIFN